MEAMIMTGTEEGDNVVIIVAIFRGGGIEEGGV